MLARDKLREVTLLNGVKGYVMFRRDMPAEMFELRKSYWSMGQVNTPNLHAIPQYRIDDYLPGHDALSGGVHRETRPEELAYVNRDIAESLLMPDFNEWGDVFP